MKIILEYRKPNQRWQSFGPEILTVTHSEVEKKMFGWVEDDQVWHSTFTLNNRPCPPVVSQATLNNLFTFEDTGELTEAQVPISKSTLKVSPSDVALLSIYEYETCLKGATSILECEALLAAAKHIEDCGNEVRFFCFRN